MRWKYFLIFLVCMGLATSVGAEFYRYTDENGVTRFTDSYVDVPVDQRPHVKRFAEPDDHLSPEEIAERERLKKERAKKTSKAVQSPGPPEQTGAIKQRKADLDKISAQLIREQKALENERKTIPRSDFKRNQAFNNKVIRFNKRLAEHERELKAFNDNLGVLKQKAKALDQEKAELDKISARLMKEKKALELEKKNIPPSDLNRFNAHKEKVTEFNKQVADFKKKQEAFNQKAQAFNQQMDH
jgi:hypothetical protein